ncbi:MAG TPA: hypothetical protein VG675_08730 [Bryobacteraceae bacterium]|nr:hypothetical protein [Bryobacteraceae bacterium]
MPNYVLVPASSLGASTVQDVGSLLAEFDAFKPDPDYTFNGRIAPERNSWKTVKPATAPPIPPLPLVIQKVLKATWKYAEPSRNNTQGSPFVHPLPPGKEGPLPKPGTAQGITIGARRRVSPTSDARFNPQVRPTTRFDALGNLVGVETKFLNETAIASDWGLLKSIPRTNAVTFRGDRRSPVKVLTTAGGFYPPNSRTDRSYLENNIFEAFQAYVKRRWDRDLKQWDFLRAVDTAGLTAEDQTLLVDYLMWRKITEREAVHLGRMVENECLKGYISTAKSIDTSLSFATAHGTVPGWLYLTVVHGGFIVPPGSMKIWGSEEGEIAQWGPIPAARIVGFVHVVRDPIVRGIPEGPIFIRRSFRTGEPKAFEHMFKVMSGMIPD